jgi:hypothetical protein
MALIISDTIIDEEFRTPATGAADEHEVSTAAFDDSAFKAALGAISGLTFVTSPTGFPQYAERTNFATSSNPVTDYFLSAAASGTPLPSTGTATSLKLGETTVFLFPTSNPDIVVGRLGTENGAIDAANPNGAVVLVIGIEETKAGGFVTAADMWIALHAPLTHDGADLVDSADELDLAGLLFLGSSFDTTTAVPFENFNGVPSGNNLFNVIFPSDGSSEVQLLLTGSKGETLSTVNVSTTGVGAGSQHIDVGATLRIDTVSGMIKSNVDSAPEVNQASNVDYTDRVELIAADFEVTQLNPGSSPARVDIRVSAFNANGKAQEGTYLTDAIAADGAPVTIDREDVIVLNGAGQDITASLTIVQDGNSVIIKGLDDGATNSNTDGYQVFFTTDGVRFDRFLITNVDPDGTTLDIGNLHVTAVKGGTGTEFGELGSHLRFQDDGPRITASGTTATALIADETTLGVNPSGSFAGLFNTPDPGADAPASLAYSLGVSSSGAASGLVDTASGDAVFLFLQGGKVVGRTGDNATAAASGPVVFEISVAQNGTVALDQQRAVVHTDSNDPNSTSPAMLASLITLTATASDAEPDATDDSASVTVAVGDKFLFRDDGPAIAGSSDPSAPNDLVVKNLPNDPSGTDSSSFILTPGADGLGSFSFIGPADSSGDFQWAYNPGSTSAITGTYKGTTLYTLVLNSDGTYTFDLVGALPNTRDQLDVSDIKAGAPNTDSILVGTLLSANNVKITGDSKVGTGNINESNAFVGVDNGNLDAGESLTFTLQEGDEDPLLFEGLAIGTKSAQGGIYKWTAVLADGVTVVSGPADGVFVGKNGTLTIDPADVGLLSSITVTKVTGSATKIGLGDIQIITPPSDATFNFDVRLTDGDGDYVDQGFTVSIDGNNDGSITSPVSALAASTGASMGPAYSSVDMLAVGVSHQHHLSDYLI